MVKLFRSLILTILLVVSVIAYDYRPCHSCRNAGLNYCTKGPRSLCSEGGCPNGWSLVTGCPIIASDASCDAISNFVPCTSQNPTQECVQAPYVTPYVQCASKISDLEYVVIFSYNATKDVTIPISSCYNYLSINGVQSVDTVQTFDFKNGSHVAFTVTVKTGDIVSWNLPLITVSYTAGAIGVPSCEGYCNATTCDECVTINPNSPIVCEWCNDQCIPFRNIVDSQCNDSFTPPGSTCGIDPPPSACSNVRDCRLCTGNCKYCGTLCGCVANDVECPHDAVYEDAEHCPENMDIAPFCDGLDVRSALYALYESANGANWTNNANWGSNDICEWYGVDCNGKILDLSNNNLNGPIPDTFWCQSVFQTIDLSYNKLNGILSPAIGNLKNVQHLRLNNNELAGKIPNSITKLSSVQYLYMENNYFSCEIPPIDDLAALREIHFNGNAFTGNIPSFQNNRNLDEVRFDNTCLVVPSVGNTWTIPVFPGRNVTFNPAIPPLTRHEDCAV